MYSVYDSWQADNIIRIPDTCVRDPAQCNAMQTAAYERLRVDILGNLTAAVKPGTGTGKAGAGQSAFFTYGDGFRAEKKRTERTERTERGRELHHTHVYHHHTARKSTPKR